MPAPPTPQPHSRIVGARQADGTSLVLYRREASGVRAVESVIRPWMLTSRETLPAGSPPPASRDELSGTRALRYYLEFDSWSDLWSCIRSFIESESALRGQRVPSFAEIPQVFILTDPVDQWLMRSGSAFFEDIDAPAVSRLTLTYSTEAGRPVSSSRETGRSDPDRLARGRERRRHDLPIEEEGREGTPLGRSGLHCRPGPGYSQRNGPSILTPALS